MSFFQQDNYHFPEFKLKLKEVKECCIDVSDQALLAYKYRKKGLTLFERLIKKTDVSYITSEHCETLTNCALSLIVYFHYTITIKEIKKGISKKKKKNLEHSFSNLELLVHKLPEHIRPINKAVLSYLEEFQLWQTEFLSASIIKILTTVPGRSTEIISEVFTVLDEDSEQDDDSRRVIIRVLCKALENYSWIEFNTDMMIKVLRIYYHSVIDKQDALRKGLEICLKTIIKNVSNNHILMIIELVMSWVTESDEEDETEVYDFGTVLQFATQRYVVNYYIDSLSPKLMTNIIRLIESRNTVRSLLGHKMFQNLLNRNKNEHQFFSPRIYFLGINYNIIFKRLENEDREFMKTYRKQIHDSFVASLKYHGKHRGIVETVYCSLALLLVEVPCGLTAAAVVCIVMILQDHVLSPEFNEALYSAHRLHALIMSILSLVCWVHSATTFYDYLYNVMECRAYEAPFLNPPLKYRYQYAEHHVLWNKRELFFEDWQCRYGIWTCFRHTTEIATLEKSSNQSKSFRKNK